MKDWRWVSAEVASAIHDRQIAEHGGRDGIRDVGSLESTLTRPVNLAGYEQPDAADLAASYAFGFARNHVFIDGNKRMAWIVARVFLLDNGYTMHFDAREAITMIEALAAGTIDEGALAQWFRERLR